MIGSCRARDVELSTIFTGAKYAPEALKSDEEGARELSSAPVAVQLDIPDWLLPLVEESTGGNVQQVLAKLQSRAPVYLRVNRIKSTRDKAIALLASQDITAIAHELSPTALEVIENPRRIAQSKAYGEGTVELQDAASQAVVDALGIKIGISVLDYCAGGGGKSLAISAFGAAVTAHDAAPQRMKDLPGRAARAGSAIVVADAEDLMDREFDLVLCDVPCSGSGSWRRSPDSKWSLTPERLHELCSTQSEILDDCRKFVRKDGVLAYVTCSLFDVENGEQITAFMSRHPEWRLVEQKSFSPVDGGDGFYLALLTRT
jgi:16S rRNA (cytosine967-C5)-methyltransferase